MNGDKLVKEWDKLARVDVNFASEIEDIIKERIKMGLESPLNPNGMRRATKALIRTSLWQQVKDILINSDWEEDRWV